jgi:hypothetical protein
VERDAMKAVLLLLLPACAFDATESAIWSGTITRDGVAHTFVGYDPYPAQGQEFGSSPATMGYLHPDGPLLISISLPIENVSKIVNEQQTTLPIKRTFLTSEFGMGVSYIEQIPADSDQFESEQPFRFVFEEGASGTMTGSFQITGTDYDSFMDGTLDATLDLEGRQQRRIQATVHWQRDK